MQWQNWLEVCRQVPFTFYVRNRVRVINRAVLGQMLSITLVAYGFTRFRFLGRDFWIFRELD